MLELNEENEQEAEDEAERLSETTQERINSLMQSSKLLEVEAVMAMLQSSLNKKRKAKINLSYMTQPLAYVLISVLHELEDTKKELVHLRKSHDSLAGLIADTLEKEYDNSSK